MKCLRTKREKLKDFQKCQRTKFLITHVVSGQNAEKIPKKIGILAKKGQKTPDFDVFGQKKIPNQKKSYSRTEGPRARTLDFG